MSWPAKITGIGLSRIVVSIEMAEVL